jgi:hypothetical protein
VFEAVLNKCLTSIIIDIQFFLCLSWRHIRSGGIAPQIFNLCSRWKWVVSFMLWYFVPSERASVYMLNTGLSIYHVNQQTKLVHSMSLLYWYFSGPKTVFIRLLIFSNFSCFTYMSIFHSHNVIHLKLKVHQGIILCTSCVPEKVGINQKGKKKKLYSH